MVVEPEIRAAVAAEREAQVALYASLTEAQWGAPSLCAGWSVHTVLAHTTMPFRYSVPRVVLELVRARGNFDRMADRRARRDAADLTPEQLLSSLRDNIEHPWAPPGGGPVGALSHDVIHGLDVAAALGMDDRASPQRVAMVLAGMRREQVAFFGVDLTGIELRATDVEWSHGVGDVVRGRAQDLLLVLCGRRVRAERLDGEAVTRLAAVRE
ncbi:maleylpyruvate isomerase family mycothiol-dependent enzyme [Pseudonocardia sp.]|uniref:maleylpyruvate isomerase family mycothiol-dependent enzyme n=1 Tax=Pseudonocardia sp. TaxID=60912 RepID=UPI00262158B7|nr:maleylpyruvate isomerase family mycothiol-dependent enzyme [Pseudonocardia sp.]